MSKIHQFAYCGNLREVKECLKSGQSIAELLNKNNKSESTLHSCARGGRENATKIAGLLVNSIPVDSRAYIVNLADSDGRTAIYYAVECSAESLVRFLLEEGATIPPEDQKVSKDGNSLTHLAAVNGCVGILKLLIGSGFPACTIQDGLTPLHLCAQNEDTEISAACVEFLASVYTGPEVNFPRQSDRRTVLHVLAESSSILMLKTLIGRNKNIKLLLYDANKKTALDLAVESCQNKKAEQCVDVLMKAGVNSSDVQRTKFLEMFSVDYSESSPLDLAIQFRSARIVSAIITNLPDRQNWIESSKHKCKQHLANIYKITPEALPPLMTQCLELSTQGESVEADFGPITGYSSSDVIQSKYLHGLLQNKNTKRTRKTVLLHPLVQLYVEQRWNQLYYLNLIALLIRVIWLGMYTILVQTKYDQSTCTPSNSSDLLSWLSPTFACNEGVHKTLAAIFLFSTVLLGLNEIFRLLHDWRSLISYFKMANVILAFITGVGCFIDEPHFVFYNTAAFGFLVAFLMVSQEFAKRGYTEIAAFGKVVYRTCFLAIFVIVVLFAFRIGFKILLPSLKDQLDGPVQGFVKVLVLMTGEYDYKDIFHEGGQDSAPSSGGSLLFFMFVIIVTIALANLLTAFAVDDTERLMRDARSYITETRLEQIHQWEILLRWTEKKGINFFNLLIKPSPWIKSGELVMIPVEDAITPLGGDENIIDGLRAERRSIKKYQIQNGESNNMKGEADTKC